ncbi:MAG TPA: SDR family oxidoreductase [Gemmatimonadaceae bacterium]|nr:SDR family oxidoreductase [Gemmatimonadaceae bacterium]
MAESKQRDPRGAGEKPPYPAQPQETPGTEDELTPGADHGESSYRGADRLTGRVALITGADSGIGRAVALAFAREGADVVISYLDEHDDARETQRLVEEAGRRALVVAGDIADEAHCTTLVRRTVDELGRLDILVNNAAFQMTRESIQEISTEEFDRTFRTNVYAMFWLCKAALPHMPAGGAIINTTSIQSSQPTGQLLPYAATKAAIANFTMGLAQEAAERGVRVNAVAPGPVWTPLIPSTMPPEKVRTFGQDTLLKRAAQPKEMAPIFVLLASDEGSYITGMIYGATGGKPLV